MLLFPKTDIIDNLIQLSKIFKEGFTIAINNGKIEQAHINTGYVVSYKTIITINLNNGNTKLHDCKIPLNTIIGGWLDKDDNIYYMGLNTIFRDKDKALICAIKYNQKTIYDLANQKVITEYKGVKLK